ncbi:MAG TPA: lipase maturation factor family protein [Candidatus Eisenbacteria bacterium]
MPPPPKPLLLWDGHCGFCRLWVARWQRSLGDRVDCAPYQEVASRFPERPLERFEQAVQLLEPDGRWSEGAEAVFRSLAHAPGRGWPLWLYRHLPGFAAASEWGYRLVARRRRAFSRITAWVWGRHVIPPDEVLTSWLFLRLLAVTYGIAFVSLWTQILGLVGRGGILPAREFLQAVAQHEGPVRYWFLPTLCWIQAGDGFLLGLCAAGTLLSVLLVIGVTSVPCLIVLWACYLSLAVVCRDFLWFQWDSLLLETGFLALFLSPRSFWSRPATDPAPTGSARWLLRWLLFRLMLSSAAVKLTSGDPTWRKLTALRFHYETQPLPPWTAWFAHQLPAGLQTWSAAVMFAIEGLVPFVLFGPRRIRFAGAAAITGLQGLIFLTGNYCFFNLLTVALCVLVLDDGVWPGWLRSRLLGGALPEPGPNIERPRSRWLGTAAVMLFLTSLVPTLDTLRWPIGWLGPLPKLYDVASPFRIVNRYGLFAVMTTRRPEIVLEGSADGVRWLEYEFRYKPGDLGRRPAFVAPHQPRLDWQMWFAALSDFRREPWFLSFCQRLLEGSAPVRSLLGKDPFPRAPPRYLRALVYDYHFTDPAIRRATGRWWRRELLGLYCPVLALEEGRLVALPLEARMP